MRHFCAGAAVRGGARDLKKVQRRWTMARALWNGQVVAESDRFELVEGNVYFPPGTIKREYFQPSAHHTTCAWKGEASYYDLVVDGAKNENAAWYYPTPKDAAKNITGHVAFWKGVTVER
jgi:uncharacterized protein (DUF427 family)